MSGLEGRHANKLQVPHSYHLTPPLPPSWSPQGHRSIWTAQSGLGRSYGTPAVGSSDTTPYMPSLFCTPGLTLAFKLLGRCGKEQFALHVWGPSTASNAWFLIACLHPARQPAEVAVTVQGVGTDGPGSESREKQAFWLQGSFSTQHRGYMALCQGLAKTLTDLTSQAWTAVSSPSSVFSCLVLITAYDPHFTC